MLASKEQTAGKQALCADPAATSGTVVKSSGASQAGAEPQQEQQQRQAEEIASASKVSATGTTGSNDNSSAGASDSSNVSTVDVRVWTIDFKDLSIFEQVWGPPAVSMVAAARISWGDHCVVCAASRLLPPG
jgi:hypothetical protein